ncbi:MAG: DUF5716 family protein [Oscillospiraceae bacterium]|nr:DUF5716 family protein [Oscillospiraceae bacterium]
MKLFEAVHPDVFTLLASPNKNLYANALEVLYEAYQDHLKIPEQTLYSMLRGKLEKQLDETTFAGEDIEGEIIDEDELRETSGKARFLMRKLHSRGWYEKERGSKDFEEYIIVPGYSSMLLELFHQLTSEDIMRGYSYVFSTYSSLKVAKDEDNAYEKMLAVYSAYDNTQELISLLKSVYHNVNRFFQMQIELHDINKVLASHFDDFGQGVIESYIRPLKIRDSVPKYKVPIRSILDEWLEDDGILYAMSNAAFQDKRGENLDSCKIDLMEKMFRIKDQYERIESDYLDEIDQQVRRYTRATTQKIENLSNRDQNTRGNLNYLLTAMVQSSKSETLLDNIQSIFQLFEQGFISEKSLWNRREPAKREKTAPVTVEEAEISEDMLLEIENMISLKYGKAAVAEFMASLFANGDQFYTKDMNVSDDHAYLMSLLSVSNGSDPDSFYQVEILEGDYTNKPYQIPQLRFTKKE